MAALLGLCALLADAGVAQTTSGAFFPAQAAVTRVLFFPGREIGKGDLNGDGVDDLVAANAMLTAGSNTMPFRGLLYEESGTAYAPVTPNPSLFPTYINGFRRTALADFDEDGRPDAVTLTFPFELLFSRNEGQGRVVQGFPAHALVANFAALLGLTFPNTPADPSATTPVFVTGDFDHDGHVDLLVGVTLLYGLFAGGGPPAVTSGGLVFFFGNGNGTFAPPQLVPTPDAPIDAEFVDWDGDGIADTLLHLGQTAVVTTPIGQYQDYLTTFDVTTSPQGVRSIAPRGPSQWLGNSRFTSFVYVPGTATTPRVLAFAGNECPVPTSMRAQMWATEIDAAGQVVGLPLALNPTIATTGNCDMQGIQAADFDRDGNLDLVGLVEVEATLATPVQHTEIAFVAGPFDAFGSHGPTGNLTTAHTWSATLNHPPMQGGNFVYAPNRGYPEVLQVVNLDSDRAPDLLVSDVVRVSAAGANEPSMLSILNLTPNVLGLQTGNVRRLGYGTPDPAGRLARCGIQGGDPVFGNGAFRISLRDAPMAGFAAVFGAHTSTPHGSLGLNMALVPEFAGLLQPLVATQPGAGSLEESLPLPTSPALLSATSALFQWVIFDATNGVLECSDAILIDYGQ